MTIDARYVSFPPHKPMGPCLRGAADDAPPRTEPSAPVFQTLPITPTHSCEPSPTIAPMPLPPAVVPATLLPPAVQAPAFPATLVRSPQLTDTLLMVRPVDFGFNEETGADNVFQHVPPETMKLPQDALREFDGMVNTLRDAGVQVLVLEGHEGLMKCPDAVFPNNWISVEHDGTVVVYPMKTPNRQAETLRLSDVRALLQAQGHCFLGKTVLVGDAEHHALEGTGSIIIDHLAHRLYAAISERCDAGLLERYAQERGYVTPVAFRTRDSHGTPFYHTNVMMSLGDTFAVVCADAIVPEDRERVLRQLSAQHDVIVITPEQTEQSFCANILQVCNEAGDPLVVMSRRAYEGFTDAQRKRLATHGKLVPVNIDTIEAVGGGSARCMMAQVFAPKRPH